MAKHRRAKNMTKRRRKAGSKTANKLIAKHLKEAGAFFQSATGKKAIAEFCKEEK